MCDNFSENAVVYATERSQATAPVLLFFCVDLWFILQGTSCLVLPCSFSLCFFSPFSSVIASLGEEGASLFAPPAIFCLFCTR